MKFITFKYFAPVLLCILTSCWAPGFLTVQTDYLSHENLASFHVGTPDPMLYNPPVGQQLTVTWRMPKKILNYADLHVEVTLRLRNQKEISKKIGIVKAVDCWVFTLMNNDYFDTGGILTYKVVLMGGGEVLDSWYHQLWTELIEFKQEDENDS